MIRANQGHTIAQVNALNLKLLTRSDFDIIHGTYFDCYPRIKNQGLSRMKRNHIHFAKGLNFISGLRRNAQIFIYIDFQKARDDEIEFFESDNNVILSPGNSDGYIEPKYFLRVVTASGQEL
ncbi:tRNA 2'-phosphotransferase 1 [Copidosoma floridanum]|uniref:tRNA 2'-phosphotransferase 1 n=1 Tax=Copidosoma floridanum TaxID=29053 RepID=UPI0006C99F0F|nr:tRNA 2'-phosphotransferase 1 [Copidosoma floridanum]